jgi:hypothetical protein
MEEQALDLDLLLSVSAGLGRWESDRAGRRVFRKDDDCTGALFFRCCVGSAGAADGRSVDRRERRPTENIHDRQHIPSPLQY